MTKKGISNLRKYEQRNEKKIRRITNLLEEEEMRSNLVKEKNVRKYIHERGAKMTLDFVYTLEKCLKQLIDIAIKNSREKRGRKIVLPKDLEVEINEVSKEF